jgi:DNA-binding protein H-NS
MKNSDFDALSVDELWVLHQQIANELARKIAAEKARLDQRLRELKPSRSIRSGKISHARRPYPQVLPKYRNPAQPGETWAGRGKQPRWLAAQIGEGKALDDFRV